MFPPGEIRPFGRFPAGAGGYLPWQQLEARGAILAPLAERRIPLIVLGAILLVIGFIADISILWTIGIILLVVGAALAILGATGRAVAGRKHWF